MGYPCFELKSQADSASSQLNYEFYLEPYWGYDFGQPASNNRPAYFCSYNRHNEVNLNLGLVKVNYTNPKLRASFGLMSGTYANANMQNEPGVLKNIYESFVGVKLSSKKKLWLDAGIFSSHIGFESAKGIECWNLSRSLLADNSPYFETGIKVSYESKNEKWLFSGLVLNGWQRIQRVQGIQTPALGHQITYKAKKVTVNSSSYAGIELVNSNKVMRYFHNFYAKLVLTKKVGLIAGFDIGAQQNNESAKKLNFWYSPVGIFRFTFNSKSKIAARIEYFNDKHSVIIPTQNSLPYRSWGYSFNYDYQLSENALWRLEFRTLTSYDTIFSTMNNWTNSNYFAVSSLAIQF